MKNIFQFIFLLLFILNTENTLIQAQDERKNLGDIIALNFQFGAGIPAADFADRYGTTLSIGTGIDYITEHNNWILGWKLDYQFGNEVKEFVLESIASDGNLYGLGQSVATEFGLKQRGFYTGLHIGKIFSFSENNTRSGIRLTLGAGLWQHKIRLQQDPSNPVPQIDDDYAKGYDRLSNGLSLRQFVGYQLLSKDKLMNLMIGVEFLEGFTKNRRSYNFDEMRKDDTARLDILYGLKLGWTLPFYIGESTGQIYY